MTNLGCLECRTGARGTLNRREGGLRDGQGQLAGEQGQLATRQQGRLLLATQGGAGGKGHIRLTAAPVHTALARHRAACNKKVQ